MFQFSESFIAAAEDLRYLLARGYPRPGALTFAGNRYQLPKSDREVLNRAVYPEEEAHLRRDRLLTPDLIAGRSVGVDGHNVIITLEAALRGDPLVLCDDGLVRDVTGAHGSYRPSEMTPRAIELVIDYLVKKGAGSAMILFDAPMAMSGELAAQASAALAGRGVMGRARAVPAPDAELASFGGVVGTSDSALIDRAAHPLDLAGCVIRDRLDVPLSSITG